MPLDKKALKAKLLSHYSARLDDVLEHVADEKRQDISEIEEIALNLRQEVGENVTETLAEHESNQEEVDRYGYDYSWVSCLSSLHQHPIQITIPENVLRVAFFA